MAITQPITVQPRKKLTRKMLSTLRCLCPTIVGMKYSSVRKSRKVMCAPFSVSKRAGLPSKQGFSHAAPSARLSYTKIRAHAQICSASGSVHVSAAVRAWLQPCRTVMRIEGVLTPEASVAKAASSDSQTARLKACPDAHPFISLTRSSCLHRPTARRARAPGRR